MERTKKIKCNNTKCSGYDDEDYEGYNCGNYHDPSISCTSYNSQTEIKINLKGTKNMSENKFDFDKMAQVKGNAVNAMDTTKNVIIQLQKGRTVVAVVKSSLKKAPGAPDSLKLLLDTPYGDLVVGMILHTMAPILTANETVISAVKAANVAGAVSLSDQFTFIQDAVVNAIESIPNMDTLKTMVDSIGGQDAKVVEDEPDARDANVADEMGAGTEL